MLLLFFLITLPLVNPWIRGDGVEYYAYVRSLIIDGNLHFEKAWQSGNPSFRQSHLDADGRILPMEYTRTGHVVNLASVGPSLLWSPFFLVIHGIVLGLNQVGMRIAADGFSRPYVISMAAVTALYGFAGLLFSFSLARSRVEERSAFWATLGIWFASSLPVYMYFNPFWSHAHSAFAVALFLWYWNRTRNPRTAAQWMVLGLLAGLMVDTYYPNGIVLIVPLLESLRGYWLVARPATRDLASCLRLLFRNILFLIATGAALLPTFIIHQIIYGNPLESGYAGLIQWQWQHPALLPVLFSSNHGLLSWTPVLVPALLGLFFLRRHDAEMAVYFGVAFVGFYALLAAYPSWDGISAFGGRAFISLTPIFVVGLAALLQEIAQRSREKERCFQAACAGILLLILWNLGFMFQWGMHLIPPRGPISWRQMAYNQVAVVPARAAVSLRDFLFRRRAMMQHIEQIDQQQLHRQEPEPRR